MVEILNKSRWYDKEPKAARAFKLVQNLQTEEKEQFADYLFQVVDIIKNQKNPEHFHISIGRNKIFSYYQAFHKRRNYDKIPELMRAMNRLNTISLKDREQIIDGILLSLEDNIN